MRRITATYIAAAALACLPLSLTGASLSVSPSVISNDYSGVLTLQIGGLNAGETVLVEQLSDFDGDGTPEAHDFTLAAFPLVDGQVTAAGGVTNLHVPGDLNGSAGSITAQIHTPVTSFQRRAVGKHVFRLSSPTTRFPAVLAPLTVTNTPYGSRVSGQVKSSGTNVPFALVVLFKPNGDGVEPFLAGGSDATGNYDMSAPPGPYMLAAFKNGYLADFANPAFVALTPGGNLAANVSLLTGSRKITGRLVDNIDSSRGLGGVLVVAESENGQVAVGFTDGTGNYSVGVTPALWRVGPDEVDLNGLGYVGFDQWPGADCTSGDATVPLSAPRGTAIIYGAVSTDTGTPLAGASLWGGNWPDSNSASPRTDQNGRYFSSVPAGTWQMGLSTEDNPGYANYVFSSQAQNITMTPGSAVLRNFTAKAAPFVITGYLRGAGMAPVGGVRIWGTTTSGSPEYTTEGLTDENGFFSMPAFSGSWNVGAACDGDEGLLTRGFSCLSGTQVNVANANATVNLTATPCTGLNITTGSLPNGLVSEYYSFMINADSCGGFPNWSLAPGSGPLPPGLIIVNNGQISGTPSQAGQFSFTVQVNDGTGTATKAFTLTIGASSPLAILSGDPVNATNGTPYDITLQGHGGQPPYTWTLAPGSGPLPGGLSLSASGHVSGIPNQPGEFYFRVRLTDAAQANVERLFRLLVNAVAVPVDITTGNLPEGSVGVPYNVTVQASGGQTPYYWRLALGSAPLPQGLNFSESTGQIYGTPIALGTFQFIIHVQDSATLAATDEQVLSITIREASRASVGKARVGADGKFQFQIDGAQGVTYAVEMSTDLQTWTPLRSTNAPSNSFIFVADPPAGARGYFRVRTGQ